MKNRDTATVIKTLYHENWKKGKREEKKKKKKHIRTLKILQSTSGIMETPK